MSRFLRRSDGPGDYLQAVAGPAGPADEPDGPDVPVDIVIAPAASTVGALLARLARLDPAGRLVGAHRIVVATITPDTGAARPESTPVEPLDPTQPVLDRSPTPLDSDHGPVDPGPPALDRAPGPADLGPLSVEAVALLIGRFNRRAVTGEQLRLGLRIGGDKARELRDKVNAELYPQEGRPDDD